MPPEQAIEHGQALIDESQILSPGAAGRVFNPIVIAEFRRWRARPFTYMAIVILVFAGIVVIQLSNRLWLGPATTQWGAFGRELVGLLVRPSSILPVLMVWRALMSFRDGGLFKPFRTTFLTPADFLWGIVTVPFLMSGLILMLYTGFMIAPSAVAEYFGTDPEKRTWSAFASVLGVLTEGSCNGAAICFLALYFGIRGGARLSSLFPIAVGLLVFQLITAVCNMNWIYGVFNKVVPAGLIDAFMPLRQFWRYGFMTLPKLVLLVLLWRGTKGLLREVDEL